jgi:hypothetical protein
MLRLPAGTWVCEPLAEHRADCARQITYVKTSQGFDWNQDIFLPSSSDITVHNGINQPESVHEIFLSEKEEGWLPSS